MDSSDSIGFETFLKMNKVDLSPKELFAKYKIGGSKNIREIAVYCVQDCELCNRLMNKLDVITNNVGMGNVCHIPLDWLFLRGQGVKIYSLVARQCRLEGFVLKLQNIFAIKLFCRRLVYRVCGIVVLLC